MMKDIPSQIRLLYFIRDNPRTTPLLINKKLNIPSATIRTTLSTLAKLGLVKTIVRGSYEITPLGESFLADWENRNKEEEKSE